MFNKINRSLRFKLTIMLMTMMVLTVLGSVLITKLFVNTYFLGQLKHQMIDTYNKINQVFLTDALTDEEIKNHLAKIAANGDLSIFILCEDGTVYTNTNEKTNMWNSLDAIARLLLQGKDESDLSDLFKENKGGYYIFHQNYDEKMDANFYDLVGALDNGSLIAVRTSALRFNENVNSTMRLYLDVCVVAIAIGCIAMFVVSSAYVKPIREMAEVAKKMSQLDFNAKVTNTSRDEVGELGKSINSMSMELERTISELKTANAKLTKDIEEKIQIDEMRKEFLSHVSHELKTPIALIQGYAEGLKENISDDEESREFYCEVIIDEADRMNKMVKKLLALNELEFGNDTINFERFDIVELIKNINASSDILLKQNELQICMNIPEAVYVWGDEFLLEEVYSNYLSNAIHYAKEGTSIIVNMKIQDNILRTSVFNEGNPIPEDELDKIWIKFYKVDKARTREYGGSGIGLSVVAATMKLHGREYGANNYENGVEFFFDVELAKSAVNPEMC